MLWLLIFLIALVGCIGFGVMRNRTYNSRREDTFLILSMILGIFVIISLVLWPSSYFSTKAEIAVWSECQNSLDRARESGGELELVHISQTIIDRNMRLAKWKYWNKTSFGNYWIPDEVELLESLR